MNVMRLLNPRPLGGAADALTITLRGRLTCTCPFNGRQDSAIVEVVYMPTLSLIELEAFAAYLSTFSECRISHEDATRTILATLCEEIEPRSLTVTTTWEPVEGIDCLVVASRP